MGYARISLSPELLLAGLHLPADTRIVGADMEHSAGDVVLTVAHPDLKDAPVEKGGRAPFTAPIFSTVYRPDVSFVGWGQD